MGLEFNSTGVWDVKASGLSEFSCIAGSVSTVDSGDIRFGGKYQELVRCHLKNFLSKRSPFKLTVGSNSFRALLVEGTKASRGKVGT